MLEAEAEADAAEREADAAEREAEQAAKPADGRLSVRITTLKNISEVAVVVPSTSVRELKGMYEKLTGTRAGQQQMWFAVPTGTEGAVDVESFPWYAKSLANGSKPKALLDMIATHPLVQGMDDQTVGGIAALQNSDVEAAAAGSDQLARAKLQAYMILSIKGSESHQMLVKAEKNAEKYKYMTKARNRKYLIGTMCVLGLVIVGGILLFNYALGGTRQRPPCGQGEFGDENADCFQRA